MPGVYNKRIADLFIVPYLPEDNFLNDSGGAIQPFGFNDCLPYALVKEDLDIILPEREDEGTSGIGEGRNETVVLESQFKVGAGAIPNVAHDFLMIPRLGGDITVTHQTAEVWTVVCSKTQAQMTTGTYINFDVIDSNFDHFQYTAWFDKNGDGTTDKPTIPDCYDPVDGTDDGINKITTQAKREMIVVNISADVTAQEVADALTAAITAKDDVSAANGGGTSTTVTVTNGSNGAVIDAHDIDAGLTVATTTQGRTKIEIIFDATSEENMGNFGFHFQRNYASEDTLYAITGVTVAEHTLEVESGEGDGGVMKEEVSYMTSGVLASYGALTMLDKPRSFYGVEWTKNLSPFGNKFKNHGWHTANENHTITLNSIAIAATWFGWKVVIENDLSHDYDGGGEYASGVSFDGRGCTITINVQPEDHKFYEMNRQHHLDYDGDLLIQLKSIRPGTGDAVFVQFDCDKCRQNPFQEQIAADGKPEKYEIELVPAPGAVYKYTIQTYIPNYAFGLGGQ